MPVGFLCFLLPAKTGERIFRTVMPYDEGDPTVAAGKLIGDLWNPTLYGGFYYLPRRGSLSKTPHKKGSRPYDTSVSA